MPLAVERPLYILAPVIALGCALVSIAVVPFGAVTHVSIHGSPGMDLFEIANVNIGLLVILGVTSIGVYGIALSGWSSNNKYSLLGSLRSTAQVVSYELALGLSLVGVVLRSQSLNLRKIVDVQSAHGLLSWNFFGGFQFVAFFIYLMAAYAETNRSPFDLPEAETRAGSRIPHRVQLHEVRHVLHGGIRQHDYGKLRRHAAVFRRRVQSVWASLPRLWRPGSAGDPVCLLVRRQGLWFSLSLHLGAVDTAALSL